MLTVVVYRSSYGGVAKMRYALPVSWMTSLTAGFMTLQTVQPNNAMYTDLGTPAF